jgi:hypothetical protein
LGSKQQEWDPKIGDWCGHARESNKHKIVEIFDKVVLLDNGKEYSIREIYYVPETIEPNPDNRVKTKLSPKSIGLRVYGFNRINLECLIDRL